MTCKIMGFLGTYISTGALVSTLRQTRLLAVAASRHAADSAGLQATSARRRLKECQEYILGSEYPSVQEDAFMKSIQPTAVDYRI